MPSLASSFKRPLLIYDDKCYSCAKFAEVASMLSRGWIRTAGHYYSQQAKEAKEMIFPGDYDATKMFWLINKSGAYGARSGLLPLAKEIFIGIFRGRGNVSNINASCEFNGTDSNLSCYAFAGILKRIIGTLRKGTTFIFNT
ncbi:MAG: hypothetical protein M3M91_00425 [Thermoproteota archaeon]|nr:hypothetical protein [Thermoproteota archaeon]